MTPLVYALIVYLIIGALIAYSFGKPWERWGKPKAGKVKK